jgi:hypothetical protein
MWKDTASASQKVFGRVCVCMLVCMWQFCHGGGFCAVHVTRMLRACARMCKRLKVFDSHVYTYIYIYIYMHACIYIYIYEHAGMCVCVCANTHAHIHEHSCTQTWKHTCAVWKFSPSSNDVITFHYRRDGLRYRWTYVYVTLVWLFMNIWAYA